MLGRTAGLATRAAIRGRAGIGAAIRGGAGAETAIRAGTAVSAGTAIRAGALGGDVRADHGRSALVRRPGAGPTVHNPQPVEELRVLGGTSLPPGSGPDPVGAVRFGPAVAQRPGPGGGVARRGVDPAVPVRESDRTPRARWEAAVAARPLETPRALPAALHAMAVAITGRARAPLFTTGPATRHALAAAGALGATTGTVVHLPAVPTAAPAAVLAHELTHTRNPVRRPRFLLAGMSGLLDDDERSALSAGRDRLVDAGRDRLGDLGRDGLAAAGQQRLRDAAPMAAGIVDQLPVGGGVGAVGEVATRAARAAVLEAAAAPIASATGRVQDTRAAVTDTMSAATGVVADDGSAVTGAVGAAVGAAAGPVGTAASALDPDKVVEIVEARLLREIERRGGRWAGVF